MDIRTLSIINSLKGTSKGKLSYDTDWFTSRRLQETIEECTSPPTLTVPSPVGQSGQADQINSTLNTTCTRKESTSDSSSSGQSSDDTHRHKTESTGLTCPGFHTKAIAIADEDWKSRTRMAISHRQRLFEEHTAQLDRQAHQQLFEVYLLQEDKAARHTTQVRIHNQASTVEVQEKQQKIRERHEKHAQHQADKMVEAHRKQQEEEEKQRKRLEESEKNLRTMLEYQQQLLSQLQRANQLLVSCQYPQFLHASALSRPALLAQVASTVDEVVSTARQNEVTPGHLDVVQDFCTKAQEVADYIASQVDEANKKGKEEEIRQQQQQQQQQLKEQQEKEQQRQKEQQLASSASASTTATTTAAAAAAPTSTAEKGPRNVSVDPEVLQHYTDLQQKLKQVEKDAEPLLNDPELKQLRFELQKAVNTAINTIAPISGSHLRDKWQRLATLISGKPLRSGTKTISASSHPAGIPFCKQLFARKIVKKGEEQVSSNHESAFEIAAVAVGIWQEFPDVGDLLLACFHQACPYLVPYYIPKQQDQSSEDYYKCLGYVMEGGEMEKQDKFLKRMTGLVRLYTAMVVTNPPAGLLPDRQATHPHGLEYSWIWLVRLINLPPRPDITPTTLCDMLQVAGSSLLAAYGKQFIKLLQLILQEYLPKMRETGGAGGPIARIETLLQQCIKEGKISTPKGMITSNFWRS